ncbi:hypothetical protein V1264_000492 [Littorina saxatilis]|uniref:Uncharacterized protein n=1 Tax=Littorina saxatilis TaxID=31220 RepID=A0AAN9BXA9_9CAEN
MQIHVSLFSEFARVFSAIKPHCINYIFVSKLTLHLCKYCNTSLRGKCQLRGFCALIANDVPKLQVSAHNRDISVIEYSLRIQKVSITPEHILQNCPHLETIRQKFWQEETSVGAKLWGSADELRKTADFLAATGLRI